MTSLVKAHLLTTLFAAKGCFLLFLQKGIIHTFPQLSARFFFTRGLGKEFRCKGVEIFGRKKRKYPPVFQRFSVEECGCIKNSNVASTPLVRDIE